MYILCISLFRILYCQVLTLGTLKFSSMSYPLYLSLCHMPTCCCGFHQVVCGRGCIDSSFMGWGCQPCA
jgi:hypothetical protein